MITLSTPVGVLRTVSDISGFVDNNKVLSPLSQQTVMLENIKSMTKLLVCRSDVSYNSLTGLSGWAVDPFGNLLQIQGIAPLNGANHARMSGWEEVPSNTFKSSQGEDVSVIYKIGVSLSNFPSGTSVHIGEFEGATWTPKMTAYTGNFAISGTNLTFKNGVLTDVQLP